MTEIHCSLSLRRAALPRSVDEAEQRRAVVQRVLP